MTSENGAVTNASGEKKKIAFLFSNPRCVCIEMHTLYVHIYVCVYIHIQSFKFEGKHLK